MKKRMFFVGIIFHVLGYSSHVPLSLYAGATPGHSYNNLPQAPVFFGVPPSSVTTDGFGVPGVTSWPVHDAENGLGQNDRSGTAPLTRPLIVSMMGRLFVVWQESNAAPVWSQAPSDAPVWSQAPSTASSVDDEIANLRLTVEQLRNQILTWQAHYGKLYEDYSELYGRHGKLRNDCRELRNSLQLVSRQCVAYHQELTRAQSQREPN